MGVVPPLKSLGFVQFCGLEIFFFNYFFKVDAIKLDL